ncbi:MAG: LysM peptidoglycan-binding domain-containing protein [Polyangiaceae bacterium]
MRFSRAFPLSFALSALCTLGLAGAAHGQSSKPAGGALPGAADVAATPGEAAARAESAPRADAAAKKKGDTADASPSKAKKPPPKGSKAPAKSTAKKGGKKPLPRKPGSEAGQPEDATRRIIAGSGGGDGKTAGKGAESTDLRAMRDLDLALFPKAKTAGAISESPFLAEERPEVQSSGLPPATDLPGNADSGPLRDMSWLRGLTMPDIPVRWDARVVRYLEFYRNNPRGRSMVTTWIKKSGRYSAAIRRVLADQNMPEDILWLAMVESGFDATISSPVGAAGLWQFMPDGARIYGLTVDRWVDERLDPERATVAAARYLADLRQRFGGWELAFAAYNMGYGGLLASIRKYNTNDYWELSRFEAGIPFETALYVPKIVAMAIVARNRAVFGVDQVEIEPAIEFDKVAVGSGVPVKNIAVAAGVSEKDVIALNPQLLAMRTPPLAPEAKQEVSWVVRVPAGAGARAAKSLPRTASTDPRLERYLVRWGESLEDIANQRGVTRASLAALNGLRKDEVVRAGTVLLVPGAPGISAAAAASLVVEGPKAKPVVVVPSQAFSYADRRRVFYRVMAGDTIHQVANALSVTADDLRRWNVLDPAASLHEGMTLQVYLPVGQKLPLAVAVEEREVRLLVAGTPEFFSHFEGQKGRARIEVVAEPGDTWKSLARKYGLSVGMMERINQKPRSSALSPGDRLVVYVPSASAPPAAPAPPAAANDRSAVAVAGATGAGEAPGAASEAAAAATAEPTGAVKPASMPATTVPPPAGAVRPPAASPKKP